ncbi:MAG: amino acid permease [Dehalococcoidales bacterium]|nr:amino acid permease [Dehalococcoidales bacterium]
MNNSPGTVKSLGFWSTVAIGIGGMVGGGIFAVLGLAVQMAGGGTPVAFLISGMVALLTAYSYAKLSVIYPRRGGTVEFLNQAFGPGIFTGGMNILLWISYIIMLSLYAYAFGSYGASFFTEASQPFWRHIFISGVIILFTFLNILGSRVVGRSENFIVASKILILLIFLGAGLWSIKTPSISPSTWSSPLQLVAGGMVIFLAYEGFELIANTAENVRNPRRTLPRAYFTAVIFVIVLYVVISLVTVGNLSIDSIVSAEDYALAEAARPFLGSAGFIMIAVAALLSTASAINATLYGTAQVSYIIAKEGELPKSLDRKVWRRPIEGLLITSALTLLIANLFDLSRISMMGSSGFLLIFAAVNAANVRLSAKTHSRRWVSLLGAVICLAALVILIIQRATTAPSELLVLAIMLGLSFLIEVAYRKSTGRKIHRASP